MRSSASVRARFLPVLVLPLALLLLPAIAEADRITLKNGRVVDGRIVEDGETVTIEIGAGGRITLPKRDIASVERAPTAREALAEKEAALAPGSGEALIRLAAWCDGEGLRAERDRLLWRALEIDPNQAEAREKLGYRRLGALWLTEADYQHHLGNVEHDGKWIPRAEWERLQEDAAGRAELVALESALETAARGEKEPEAAAAAMQTFRAAPEERRRYALAHALGSPDHRTRQLAVRASGELTGKRPSRSLTHIAVSDPRRSVRDEALRVLKSWNEPDTALSFIPYLESDDDRERVNAARALNVFPDRRAVPVLITTAHKIWAGFGRSHFAQLVQRSYVQDYELVSGGTGLIVSEVADPVIDTFIDGIVLDIDVRRAEAYSRIATLERITGQNFGTDFEAWAKWWQEEQGKAQS